MTAREIRQQFLDFFRSKDHKIVPSAPIVNKQDPSLMFTNAGMNQFKDYFLGNREPEAPRIADTQKCLRVSGKHNDLEEVGRDSYHHTMFEMLGNWSFGDYFKKEAIHWAWELLVDVYGLPADRLYATVFEGEPAEQLEADEEAAELWRTHLPEDRILRFGKTDNFWEMGDTGPCGSCSEIHIDLRSEAERKAVDGKTLVNADHPLVVEIWNLVFIQFNRKADGSLEDLPAKHVDTGMGFERLTMALQNKKSNYETDIFTPFIAAIEKASGKTYTNRYEDDAKADIAMRVVTDHIRAVAFAIADGQLPGNTGAGYVIRRILRRAVRYYYSFLDIRRPFLHTLIPLLADRFAEVFPELKAQESQVAKVIEGEEATFLHTLENGLKRFAQLEAPGGVISGRDAFELYDTYGFPIDLTRLLAEEKGLSIDEKGFDQALAEQKSRSKADAAKEVGDWNQLHPGEEVAFVGYDTLVVENAHVTKYRTVKVKKKDQYQIVLNQTPFYGESGGQRGDTGWLWFGEDKVKVLDTLKENELIVHVVNRLPKQLDAPVRAEVDAGKRQATSSNHSAVHLMHAALHRVLGEHALQKGQDVDPDRLRFDFSHFRKVSEEELEQIETMVNEKIRANIPREEEHDMPLEEAKASGALMLFGEKYGDRVRVITFDPGYSRELCGGTHVAATGEIGQFKILSEGAVAAGIRRIEAVTAEGAEEYIQQQLDELQAIRELLKTQSNTAALVAKLQEENKQLKKELEKLQAAQAGALKGDLIKGAQRLNGAQFIAAVLPLDDSGAMKTLAFELERELENAVVLFGAEINGKPQLMLAISKPLTEGGKLHAGNLVRELAKEIGGGGGGQPFFASAGGKDAGGLDQAIAKGVELVKAAL
jgi:alanyl-tRNA synthetase